MVDRINATLLWLTVSRIHLTTRLIVTETTRTVVTAFNATNLFFNNSNTQMTDVQKTLTRLTELLIK